MMVSFVEDFDAEDRLDDVFEGDEADGGTELVGDEHDVVALCNEALEKCVYRSVFWSDGDG